MTSFPKEKNLTQTELRGLSLHRSLGLLCRKVYDQLPMCGPGSGLGAQVRVHGAPSFPLALAGCREPGPEGAGWRSSLRGPEVYFLSPACSPPSPADACVSSGSLMCCLPPPDIPRSPDFIVQFSPVTQLCPTLCNPMDRSTPGLPVHHQLPEFTQTHVHRVSDGLYCKSLHSRALVRNDSLFPDDGRKYYPVRKVEPWKVSSRETALEELEFGLSC